MQQKRETLLPIKEVKHKARRKAIKETIFSSIKTSLGEKYLAPFAIAVNTSNPLVAIMSSISGLLGPLSQTVGSKIMKKTSRKNILARTAFFEALIWLPLVIITILYLKGVLTQFIPFAVLLIFSLYIILNNLGHPAYFSWIGEIVDKKYRGRWLSKKTLIASVITVIISILAAIILDKLKDMNLEMQGFALLFLLAFFARIKCYKIYKQEYFPKRKFKKESEFTFWQFLKQAPKTNFGKFTIFRAALGFATSISSPLLAIYLLRELQLNYSWYMIIILAGTIFSIFVLALWGKINDFYGSYKVILITSIAIPLIPILWIISHSLFYLIIIPSLIGGIAWAGFDLAAKNFIYDNVSKQKRGIAVSYYNLLIGIGVFIGAGISALLIEFIKTTWIKPIILIFIMGTILRAIVVIFGIKHLAEIRKTKIKGFKELEHLLLKEAKPSLHEEMHEIIAIKDYIQEK